MSDKPSKLQPAVRLELKHVIEYTITGDIILCLAFLVLHLIFPETVPFDYKVILGAVAGGGVAVFNFFLMALMVQKVAGDDDRERIARLVKLSYSRRYAMQIAWMVIAIFAPCFNPVAGLLPLLFPTLGIKIVGIIPALRVRVKTARGLYDEAPLSDDTAPAEAPDTASDADSSSDN